MTAPEPITPTFAIQEAMDYWDGFAVPTEWFVAPGGKAALCVFGTEGDGAQILSLDDNGDGTVATSCTDPVEFSTGGPEI